MTLLPGAERPQIFGTDGIRGRAGEGWLSHDSFRRLGEAVGMLLAAAERPRLVMARDTRPSGAGLARSFAEGVVARGCDVVDLGVAPTPALAAALSGAQAGAVISASHNPAGDNGIKLFSAAAQKLPEETEVELEKLLTEPGRLAPTTGEPGALTVRSPADVASGYAAHVRGHLEEVLGERLDLGRVSLVVDCAEGAASSFAPDILRSLGAHVDAIHAEGRGERINDGCGALHPEHLAARVSARGADCGLAFDGDADRLIMVDETGAVRDGDHLLWVLAMDLHARGRLRGETVVGTVMSNLGLEVQLEASGLRLERTPVGDRHVTTAMVAGGTTLGGEQSGHIIVRGPGPLTGDGLLAGIHVLAAMRRADCTLGELCQPLQLFPQVTLAVPVASKPPLADVPELASAQLAAERTLASAGRVLLRYSGTEDKLRIMVEGRPGLPVREIAESLADIARRCLGE